MPVARADLLRKVYKRYFTLGGKIWGRANEAEELDERVLDEWVTYFYQCSQCRRCSVFCPYGIDTAEITMAAREIMAAAGVATKYVTEVVAKVYDTGNNLGIWPAAWKDMCAFLEEDLKELEGVDIKFPGRCRRSRGSPDSSFCRHLCKHQYHDWLCQDVSCRGHLVDHQHLLQ